MKQILAIPGNESMQPRSFPVKSWQIVKRRRLVSEPPDGMVDGVPVLNLSAYGLVIEVDPEAPGPDTLKVVRFESLAGFVHDVGCVDVVIDSLGIPNIDFGGAANQQIIYVNPDRLASISVMGVPQPEVLTGDNTDVDDTGDDVEVDDDEGDDDGGVVLTAPAPKKSPPRAKAAAKKSGTTNGASKA